MTINSQALNVWVQGRSRELNARMSKQMQQHWYM